MTVFCGDPDYLDGRTDTITNPVLLVEGLSPGTALKDHNEKLEEYTQIETLQACVLIVQDAPKGAVYRRNETGTWIYAYVTGLDAEIDVLLPDANLRLSLAWLYHRVRWEGEEGER